MSEIDRKRTTPILDLLTSQSSAMQLKLFADQKWYYLFPTWRKMTAYWHDGYKQ
jgi:hypothetical protein